jgi:hypothetical protein
MIESLDLNYTEVSPQTEIYLISTGAKEYITISSYYNKVTCDKIKKAFRQNNLLS